jgi:putative SOS response-associated peptidase YedK
VQPAEVRNTEANDVMKPLHDLMPVIRDPTSDALWLDPGTDAPSLHTLLVPYPGERMEAFPVNPWVSNSKHEGPRCLEMMAP